MENPSLIRGIKMKIIMLLVIVIGMVLGCNLNATDKNTKVVDQNILSPNITDPLPETFTLWTGSNIPDDFNQIPFVPGMQHQTIQHAVESCQFLHGAAIINYKGVFYANWANSPVNENSHEERLQGRRSTDGCRTWSDLEVIAPDLEGPACRSHGVLFVHKGQLWTICARFGEGLPAKRFPCLQAEAFILNEKTGRWDSQGVVMQNCWPCNEPKRMDNGNWITSGQDKDGFPVVAISHGDDITQWDSILIPFHPHMEPCYAETTVNAQGNRILAVIRGGGGIAWISISDDFGRTWSKAGPSNMPMPRAKAYLGKLSTGQMYLLSNLQRKTDSLDNRDTLIISVSRPGESTLSRMWRIRHGKSGPPRFNPIQKGKQWSYPYGYEYEGKLYVVYSIGKEDCGLSILPLESIAIKVEPTDAKK